MATRTGIKFGLILLLVFAVTSGCDVPVKKKAVKDDSTYLDKGELVFEERFDKTMLAPTWRGGSR